MKPTKHVIASDFHVPDHDRTAVKKLISFIEEYKPDHLHILGDFVNFTGISKYDPDPYVHVTVADEISLAQTVLDKLILVTRKANKKALITWHGGNHEHRLIHFLSRNALALAELKVGNNYVLSVPHLFNLDKLDVKWLPYNTYLPVGDAILTHGHMVRAKAGFTAHGMIDKTGSSGFTGHTHRLAQVYRTQYGRTKFWIETGCLCKLDPTYTTAPDWAQGFASFEVVNGIVYPKIHPINQERVPAR